jgi:hypothetical protein
VETKKHLATLELSHSLSDISDYRDLWQIFQSTIKKIRVVFLDRRLRIIDLPLYTTISTTNAKVQRP